MTGYEQIVGHEEIIRHFVGAVSQNKVSHAYLLEGETGSGRMSLAKAFARALLCERGDGGACGVCHSCRQALAGTHPDIHILTPEKESAIKVDEIREQVVTDAMIRPYSGGHKVYIIPGAERMNEQAQNALLKTLEEPPLYVVILLLTVNAESLLSTIRSRCVLLPVRPIRQDLVETWLMEKLQLPDYQARLCASFSQGSIGRAAALAGSEDFGALRDSALLIARKARELNVTEIVAMTKKIAARKEMAAEFLEILTLWYRDVLYFKATSDPDRLIFRDQVQEIRRQAQKSSYGGLETILTAIDTAGIRLKAYAGFEVTMELLFPTIKEN